MPSSTGYEHGELVEVSDWKRIQQNTFTRWVNKNLTNVLDGDYTVDDLETDLNDGLILIKLAEVLSLKMLPRYNKKPTMRTQKLDNVSQVLDFFQNNEGIKIVNIDSSHIVDQNLKLILGLIWTLILHYSISQPIDGHSSFAKNKEKTTPKQRLLEWIRIKLLPSGVTVSNFTSDWNDGIALGALVDACLGGRFDEWHNWTPGASSDALGYTRRAMEVAESLGVAKLITAEELLHQNIDEKSVMTYLAQFPRIRDQLVVGRMSGVDKTPIVDLQTEFFVDLEKAEHRPLVEIGNIQGGTSSALIPVIITEDSAFPSRFRCAYTPNRPGKHNVSVFSSDDDSSIRLRVDDVTVEAVPAPEITGLSPQVQLLEKQKFRITNVTDLGRLNVVAMDSEGRESVLATGSERIGNSVVCCYTPKTVGFHLVNVFLDNRPIPSSPRSLEVLDTSQSQSEATPTLNSAPLTLDGTENAVIWGRGLCAEGLIVGEELPVHVDNCEHPVTVFVRKTGLSAASIPVTTLVDSASTLAQPFKRQTFTYVPQSVGDYEVDVRCGDSHLGQSPYKMEVRAMNRSQIRAIGPGLEGGVVGQKALFYVDTRGNAKSLEFLIQGPSHAHLHCSDNGDETAVVEYNPLAEGPYTITVLDNKSHIRGSPFVAWIDARDSAPYSDATSPIILRTVGLEERARVGEPFTFSIDKHSDVATLEVEVFDPDLARIEHSVHTTPTARTFLFTPSVPGKYTVSAVADKVAVAGWPFSVVSEEAVDASGLRVFGPGVGADVNARQKTSFVVDARRLKAGASVGAHIFDPFGQALAVTETRDDVSQSQVDEEDDCFTFGYTPTSAGLHRVNVSVNNEVVFDVPVDVRAARLRENLLHYSADFDDIQKQGRSSADAFQLIDEIPETVVGHECSLYLKLPHSLRSRAPDVLEASVKSPTGDVSTVPVERVGSGEDQYRISFVPAVQGPHSIAVLGRNGRPIEETVSRVPVGIHSAAQATRIYATGPGLKVGKVNQRNFFDVLGELGTGELALSMDGPAKAEVELDSGSDENGTCHVMYTVPTPGNYIIAVSFNGAPISGSPFKVLIQPDTANLKLTNGSGDDHFAWVSASDYYEKTAFHRATLIGTPALPTITVDQELRHQNHVEEKATDDHLANNNATSQTLDGDARAIVFDGKGLAEFTPGRPATFLIDTSRTGVNLLFVAVVTSKGRAEEVNVRHIGAGRYYVTYVVPHSATEALVVVKYGEVHAKGSPFHVHPVL